MFVLGEVQHPGRYTLDGPTTIMQALAIAGSWNVGSNIDQVVVLRRAEDWQLVATMLNLRDAVGGPKLLSSQRDLGQRFRLDYRATKENSALRQVD